MRTKFLLLSSFLVLTMLITIVHAQQTLTIGLYSDANRYDYIGRYWPANVDITAAVAMDEAARDAPEHTSGPPMRLFEGCDDLKVRVTLPQEIWNNTTFLKFVFADFSATGGINSRDAVTIPDSVSVPYGVPSFEVPYQIKHLPDALNGSLIEISGFLMVDTTLVMSTPSNVNAYNKYSYNIEYSARTAQHKGYIRLNIQGATPQIVCSFDGASTWVKPQDEFTDSYLDKALEAGVIYIKEPNSCLLTAIPFGSPGNIGDPGEPIEITRAITMPNIANAILSHEEGTYHVRSANNFVFTIRPTGASAGLIPRVKTNRTSIPDSEGVKIEDNGDGSYTVTILNVQQAITLSLDFTTGNETIDNGNKVWADKNILYIHTTTTQTANIYNTTGALVKSSYVGAGKTTSASLPAGFYIVKLDNGKTYKVTLR